MTAELSCVLCGDPGSHVADGDARDVTGISAAIALADRVLCPLCLSGSVPSPCVSLCTLDAKKESCRGCGRTIAELTGWRDMSPEERVAVLLRLRARRSC